MGLSIAKVMNDDVSVRHRCGAGQREPYDSPPFCPLFFLHISFPVAATCWLFFWWCHNKCETHDAKEIIVVSIGARLLQTS